MGCIIGYCRTASNCDDAQSLSNGSNIITDRITSTYETGDRSNDSKNRNSKNCPHHSEEPRGRVHRTSIQKTCRFKTILDKIIYGTRAAIKTSKVSASHEDLFDEHEQSRQRSKDGPVRSNCNQSRQLVRQNEISSVDSDAKARPKFSRKDSIDIRADSSQIAGPRSGTMPRSTRDASSISNGASSNIVRPPSDMSSAKSGVNISLETQDITIFTSIEQLCYQIINRNFLTNKLDAMSNDLGSGGIGGKVLSLFLFGNQGSNKGELAFELVEHSSLLSTLKASQATKKESEAPLMDSDQASLMASDCPLYSYIDVATLIVANIDARIREYNQLVVQTMRRRRKQSLAFKIAQQQKLGSHIQIPLYGAEDLSLQQQSVEIEVKDLDGIESNSQRNNLQSKPSSLSEASSSGASIAESIMVDEMNQSRDQEQAICEDASLFTLSTQQRSILQLKLIKYSNCVASDWVTKLIKTEIDSLESRFERYWCLRAKRNSNNLQLSSDCAHNIPNRVYMINLVPDQLSLFKTCLYLQQSINLRDLKYPFWAIKFEKRTNLKSINEGKTIGKKKSSSPNDNKVLIARIKIPMLKFADSKLQSSNQMINSESLMEGLNEKLGPKFNENFAHQFKSRNRLVRLQYNPISDYNYDSRDAADSDNAIRRRCSSYIYSSKAVFNQPDTRKMSRVVRSSASLGFDLQAVTNELEESHRRLSLSTSPINSLSPYRPSISSVATSSSSYSNLSNPTTYKHTIERSSPSSIGTLIAANAVDICQDRPEIMDALRYINHQPDWSIELELYDSSRSSTSLTTRAASATQLASIWHHWPLSDKNLPSDLIESPPSAALYLKTYQSPVRSSSRSPLTFVTNHNAGRASSRNYQLFAVRVRQCPSDTSLIMLVAKRVHRQLIRLRNNSDLVKLNKIISKGRTNLLNDMDAWLADAIKSDFKLLNPSKSLPDISGREETLNVNRTRSIMVSYAIRVDVGFLKTGGFTYAPNFDGPTQADCLQQRYLFGRNSTDDAWNTTQDDQNSTPTGGTAAPTLVLNDDTNATSNKCESNDPNLSPNGCTPGPICNRPASGPSSHLTSALNRPISSRSAGCTSPICSRPKKHVKFRLAQRPNNDDRDRHIISTSAPLKPQCRYWINDFLFLSSKEVSTNELMALVASLIRFVCEQQEHATPGSKHAQKRRSSNSNNNNNNSNSMHVWPRLLVTRTQ